MFKFVTKRQGLVDYFAARGITGEVVNAAAAGSLAGFTVITERNLPLALLAGATAVIVVDLLHKPEDYVRGSDLSPEQMDEAGVMIRIFHVSAVDDAPEAVGLLSPENEAGGPYPIVEEFEPDYPTEPTELPYESGE